MNKTRREMISVRAMHWERMCPTVQSMLDLYHDMTSVPDPETGRLLPGIDLSDCRLSKRELANLIAATELGWEE